MDLVIIIVNNGPNEVMVPKIKGYQFLGGCFIVSVSGTRFINVDKVFNTLTVIVN